MTLIEAGIIGLIIGANAPAHDLYERPAECTEDRGGYSVWTTYALENKAACQFTIAKGATDVVEVVEPVIEEPVEEDNEE